MNKKLSIKHSCISHITFHIAAFYMFNRFNPLPTLFRKEIRHHSMILQCFIWNIGTYKYVT